jgi:hypothetical protein
MKLTLLFLLIAGLGLAQNSIFIRVTKGGVESVAKVSGPAAAAGIEVIEKFMATQKVCVVTPGKPAEFDTENNLLTPGVARSESCMPKFADVSAFAKEIVLAKTEELAPQFPSAALAADVAQAKAAQEAVDSKRKALFDAARAEKP